MASIPNSDPPRAPLMEISNQRITDQGSRLEVDLANIANCSLKQIDPSLHQRHASQVDNETPDCKVELVANQLGDAKPPNTDMYLDVGGDVPPSS